eukprot:Gb_07635 [translate_table: standard]
MPPMARTHLHHMRLFLKCIHLSARISLISPIATPTKISVRGECIHKINVDITKLCKESRLKEALDILYIVDRRGIQVDSETYTSLLQVCTDMKALSEGKRVHNHIRESGFDQNIFLSTKLVNMYVICNSLVDARLVFDKIPTRNVFCWNAILRGYIRNGLCEDTLSLYHQMLREGIQPDRYTFPYALKACTGLSSLQEGRKIHDSVIASGFESHNVVASALIDMYTKCGSMNYARQVFDKMSERDIVTWSAMIAGSAQNGCCDEALKLFRQMQLAGLKPDPVTIASVLPACARLVALQHGKEIHDYIIRSGFDYDIFVRNSLIDMYTKCENTDDARHVFDNMSVRDVVSWSSIIAGYSQNGHFVETLELFWQMILAGVKPNSVTFASVLPACAGLTNIKQGKEIHNYIIRSGFESDVFVGSALIDMYAKCGNMDIASLVFDRMSHTDVVLWNAMIAGYTQNGHCNEALELFHQIQQADVKPDSVTLVSILPACAHLATLQHGKEIHAYVMRNGFESDVSVGNALIDMYAKCGSIEFGHCVFDKMSERNVISWNTMIAGYGMHGHGEEALAFFYEMQKAVMEPDCITFIALLSACSHAGLVDKGRQYFNCMSQDYEIIPRMEHYACMVDLLGRAGCLDEAWDFIKKMPLKPSVDVWGSLLGACRVHCNIDLAEFVAEHLFELRSDNAGYYVLLSNIYASAGRWVDASKVRKLIKDKGLKKEPGCSWIEIGNRVHAFLAEDRSHPQLEKIYATLESLVGPMKEAGYVPDTTFVLYDAEEDNPL